ncbi:MAG: M12 family metallo-peptidase, partial [Pseudomonadota bacterium]
MKIGFLARVVCIVTAVCLQVAAPANTAHFEITYAEPVRNLQWRSAADDSVQQKPGAGAPNTLSFQALDQGFVIRLLPNRILTRQLSLQSGQSIEVFRGVIDGMPDGWARLTVAGGLPQGLIWTGTDWLGLDILEGQTTPSLYRLTDVAIAPGAFGCDDATHLHTAADLVTGTKPALPYSPAEAVGATQEIQIGVVGDEEFVADNGSAANAESAIIARMNIADGIFIDQVGVQLTVANVQLFNSGNDPFTDVTEARDLLDEITSFRSGSSQQRSFGLTHLFTGRDLEGNTVGIAWRQALC